MTDRYSGFIVTLDRDIREDDAEFVMTAIRMVKGVASVEPVPTNYTDQHVIDTRVRIKVQKELWELADRIRDGGEAT